MTRMVQVAKETILTSNNSEIKKERLRRKYVGVNIKKKHICVRNVVNLDMHTRTHA